MAANKRLPPNPRCPLCERPVDALIYNKHCKEPSLASIVYVHGDEKHFVLIEPVGLTDGFRLSQRENLSSC